MNIFVLDTCPVKAAQLQCNKHTVKKILESAQIMSTEVKMLYKHIVSIIVPRLLLNGLNEKVLEGLLIPCKLLLKGVDTRLHKDYYPTQQVMQLNK